MRVNQYVFAAAFVLTTTTTRTRVDAFVVTPQTAASVRPCRTAVVLEESSKSFDTVSLALGALVGATLTVAVSAVLHRQRHRNNKN